MALDGAYERYYSDDSIALTLRRAVSYKSLDLSDLHGGMITYKLYNTFVIIVNKLR